MAMEYTLRKDLIGRPIQCRSNGEKDELGGFEKPDRRGGGKRMKGILEITLKILKTISIHL